MRLAERLLTPLFVLGAISCGCAVFYVGLLGLDFLREHYSLPFLEGYQFTDMIIVPLGIVTVNGVVLFIELVSVGWAKSSLKRLLYLETRTVRTDLFYLLLRLSGLNHVFAFLLSFGSVFLLARKLGAWLDFDVLNHVPNLGLQFGFVVLVNSFVFYWAHRLMHTRGMFEIHKVHHWASDFN